MMIQLNKKKKSWKRPYLSLAECNDIQNINLPAINKLDDYIAGVW